VVKSGKYFITASYCNLSLHAYCDVPG